MIGPVVESWTLVTVPKDYICAHQKMFIEVFCSTEIEHNRIAKHPGVFSIIVSTMCFPSHIPAWLATWGADLPFRQLADVFQFYYDTGHWPVPSEDAELVQAHIDEAVAEALSKPATH